MPKNYNMKEIILELLAARELSKKELLENIRKKSERSTSDKTLNESLMVLLKENKIYITNYDFSIYNGVKRIQSIKPEGIVFGLMKTDFVEIETLIKLLENDDVDVVRNASSKLKKNFRNKIDDLKSRHSFEMEEDIDTLFNKTIFYIYSQTEDQKRILINKFAWSLSNEEGSVDLFEDILNYMDAQS
jgi:SOS response regulatory protein OraA/RecX